MGDVVLMQDPRGVFAAARLAADVVVVHEVLVIVGTETRSISSSISSVSSSSSSVCSIEAWIVGSGGSQGEARTGDGRRHRSRWGRLL